MGLIQYRILEEITTRFPDVLFESCAGGGGRFDLGILHLKQEE
jgi:alpha-galactosidase